MKIHHIVPHFYPEKGGVESNVLGLARYLVNRGHEVVVHTTQRTILGQQLPVTEAVDGIRVRRYRPSVRLGYYATLFRPEVEGADVVHLHGYGFLTNDRVARTVRGVIPIVYSLHHGVAQPSPTLAARLKRTMYDPLVGRKTLHDAEIIVPASEADRQWLEARGFLRDRIHVLPTGLDSEAFLPGSLQRARERFRVDRYVVFLGRLHREKRPDHLLRAIASLDKEWGGGIVFVGPDGGERASLERLARALELRERVVFAGEVDEATKRDLLAGAECLVLPSLYEAQGIAIAEAWAQKRPIVASEVGGVPFLVEDGRDGMLYPFGDLQALSSCLHKLLTDASLASAMGQAGFNKAHTRLAWDRIAPGFEDIYESVRRK